MSYQNAGEEAKRRALAVFAKPNKYGYQLNVSNAALQQLYDAYIRLNGIKRPMSDAQRMAWERSLWEYLSKIYRACHKVRLPDYNHTLNEDVVGWQLTQLEDMINYRLVPDKAIHQLYGVDINEMQ
ncbi:MAG: hypothetical protein IJ454_04590 [Clostridia bacterium]|nr:hypothetical protein [Clostridia bacterium]